MQIERDAKKTGEGPPAQFSFIYLLKIYKTHPVFEIGGPSEGQHALRSEREINFGEREFPGTNRGRSSLKYLTTTSGW